MARMAARWLALLLALAPGPGPWGRPAPGRTAFLAAARKEWVGSVWLLRGLPSGKTIHYTADGRLIKPWNPGPWSLAKIGVEKVGVTGGEFRVKGFRCGVIYEPYTRAFKTVRLKESLTLRIAMGKGPWLVARLAALAARIFLQRAADFIAVVLPDWQPFFRLGKAAGAACRRSWRRGTQGPVARPSRQEPQLLSSAEPRFTREARKSGLTGSIVMCVRVGTDGRAHKIIIVKPLGLGLDDAAVAAVGGWRFRPATKHGQPVAVAANIVNNFHIYRR